MAIAPDSIDLERRLVFKDPDTGKLTFGRAVRSDPSKPRDFLVVWESKDKDSFLSAKELAKFCRWV